MISNLDISNAMKIKLGNELPPAPKFQEGIRRAPKREFTLSKRETEIALKNALRYIPEELHEELAPEFWMSCLQEVESMGIAIDQLDQSKENQLMNTKVNV